MHGVEGETLIYVVEPLIPPAHPLHEESEGRGTGGGGGGASVLMHLWGCEGDSLMYKTEQ